MTKFRNVKITTNGKTFDSKKEYHRYIILKQEEEKQNIYNLQEQVKFDITINNVKICSYIADFVYTRCGETIVEDVKSEITRKLPAYRLKNKLMKAVLGIEIQEV